MPLMRGMTSALPATRAALAVRRVHTRAIAGVTSCTLTRSGLSGHTLDASSDDLRAFFQWTATRALFSILDRGFRQRVAMAVATGTRRNADAGRAATKPATSMAAGTTAAKWSTGASTKPAEDPLASE